MPVVGPARNRAHRRPSHAPRDVARPTPPMRPWTAVGQHEHVVVRVHRGGFVVEVQSSWHPRASTRAWPPRPRRTGLSALAPTRSDQHDPPRAGRRRGSWPGRPGTRRRRPRGRRGRSRRSAAPSGAAMARANLDRHAAHAVTAPERVISEATGLRQDQTVDADQPMRPSSTGDELEGSGRDRARWPASATGVGLAPAPERVRQQRHLQARKP